MTAVLDLHPDTGHPAVGVAQVHAAIDQLQVLPRVPVGEYADLVAEVDRAVTRLQAVKLSLVAAADTAEVAAGSGLSGTGAWLAKHTRTAGAAAAGQVALATALGGLPATGAAFAAGEVSADHAGVIARTARQLPAGLDADQRARVEHKLVTQAKTLDPVALAKKARQALNDITTRAQAEAHHDQDRSCARSSNNSPHPAAPTPAPPTPTPAPTVSETVTDQPTWFRGRSAHTSTGVTSAKGDPPTCPAYRPTGLPAYRPTGLPAYRPTGLPAYRPGRTCPTARLSGSWWTGPECSVSRGGAG